MKQQLRLEAEEIARAAIAAVRPEHAVQAALRGWRAPGRLFLVAIGKAGWQMAAAAMACLQQKPKDAIVITKYGHVAQAMDGLRCFEAGHPAPDENTLRATQAVLDMTAGLTQQDTVLLLLSGGGSALFEKPRIPLEELKDVTRQLLQCGANIVEMNTIRKRLSDVKGGRFGAWCAPAQVKTLALSDVLGDLPDSIASGPSVADASTAEQAQAIARKYGLRLSAAAQACLRQETPKALDNTDIRMIGSVRELCAAAETECKRRGYEVIRLTDRLDCEAREAGRFLAAILRSHAAENRRVAYVMGGETVVHVTGQGLGGRNQELALAAAEQLDGLSRAAVISVGSDGTDGPTDAAGGYVDGDTAAALAQHGVTLSEALARTPRCSGARRGP